MIKEIIISCISCILGVFDHVQEIEIQLNIPKNDVFEFKITPVEKELSKHFFSSLEVKSKVIRTKLPPGEYELNIRPANDAFIPDYIILTRFKVNRSMPRLSVTVPDGKMRVSFHESLFSPLAENDIGIILARNYFSEELNASVACKLLFPLTREIDSYVGDFQYLKEGVYTLSVIYYDEDLSANNPKRLFDINVQKRNGKMTYSILKNKK